MHTPLDDPSAVLVFRGAIEIEPSGTRVDDLALVEPILGKIAAAAAHSTVFLTQPAATSGKTHRPESQPPIARTPFDRVRGAGVEGRVR